MTRRMAFQIPTLLALGASFLLVPWSWGTRNCCEGNDWLKWSQERRETYVRGFMEGYDAGHKQGCEEGTKGWRGPRPSVWEDWPVNKCLDRRLQFEGGIDISRKVTEFYRRYPGDRILLIKEVLEELARGRSMEDIHKDPPFPTKQSPEASGRTARPKHR